ncbi:transducin beta-like protein 3 [Tanacetum coccineum]
MMNTKSNHSKGNCERPAIGIDLGTTYSCVASWQAGRAEIIFNDQGNRTTPSYVAFTDTEHLIGDAAKNQVSMNPINTVFDAKPDKPMIVVNYKAEEKEFLAEEISSMVLIKMKAIQRLLRLSLSGHTGPVMGMACHASGGLLATAGAEGKVLVWDVDGGFYTHFFKGHKGVVNCVTFHPDPTRLLLFSGSDDTTARVWDLTSKKCIPTNEAIETVCVIGSTSSFASCTRVCLYKQVSLDVTVSKNDEEESKRGFTSAVMLPSGQGLLCVTTDQEYECMILPRCRVLMVDSITFGHEMVNILVSGEEYDKVFNHLDMLNAPFEGKEIWLRVQQMMKGSDIEIQEKKAKLFDEWERFTSTDGESIESYYHRFSKLINDFKRNKQFTEKIASNLKFLNNLQPEWSRHVTIVHQTKDLHEVDYT